MIILSIILVFIGIAAIIRAFQEYTKPTPFNSTIKDKPKPRNGIIGGIMFIVFGWILYPSASSEKKQPEDLSTKKVEAYTAAHDFVKNRLVSPATADFPWSADDATTYQGDSVFVINSYVDSQNSFSAMIRTKYIATVKFKGGDNWELVDIKMD